MADEITLTARITLNKDGFSLQREEDGAQFNWSGNTVASGRIMVGTTELALDVSKLPAVGWGLFINQHAANTIDIGRLIGGIGFLHIGTLGPKEMCIFPLAGEPFVKANAANTELVYHILSAS